MLICSKCLLDKLSELAKMSVLGYGQCTLVEDPCLSHECPPGFECYMYQSSDCPGCGSVPDCREVKDSWKAVTCVWAWNTQQLTFQQTKIYWTVGVLLFFNFIKKYQFNKSYTFYDSSLGLPYFQFKIQDLTFWGCWKKLSRSKSQKHC